MHSSSLSHFIFEEYLQSSIHILFSFLFLAFLFSKGEDKGRIRRRSRLISIANGSSPRIKKIWSALVDSRTVAYWTINTWKRFKLSRTRYTKKIVRPELYTYTWWIKRSICNRKSSFTYLRNKMSTLENSFQRSEYQGIRSTRGNSENNGRNATVSKYVTQNRYIHLFIRINKCELILVDTARVSPMLKRDNNKRKESW